MRWKTSFKFNPRKALCVERVPLNTRLSKAETGYVAGLLDGEGHITITRAMRTWYCPRFGSDRSYPLFALQVRISNTNKEVINWLNRRLGRSGRPTGWKLRGNRKECFQWIAVGGRALRFLEIMEPYCIVKRKQIKVAKKWFNIYGQTAPSIRAKLWMQMRALNQRGLVKQNGTSPASVTNRHKATA